MTTLIKWTFHRVRVFADGVRDWRVRTLVPIILVNVVMFGALYALMYHFGIKNLITTQKFGALIVLDEVERGFSRHMLAHRADVMEKEFVAISNANELHGLTVFNAFGEPMATGATEPAADELAQVQTLLFEPGPPTQWSLTGDGSRLIFGRYIENAPACRACHSAMFPRLGVIQVAVDLTEPRAGVVTRVSWNFLAAAAVWSALLGLMFWAGGRVIGRPIAEMERSLGVASDSIAQHDLDSLADRVRRTLNVIERQRTREAELEHHMARTEQLAALGELAAGLTHEIKNPIAGVIAALELLRDEADRASEHHALYQQMIDELHRVSGTLTSMLRLGRPHPPERAEVDLGRVVREVTTLFGARARRSGVALNVQVHGPIPLLRLDSGLMIQLLVNLLTNSLQATSHGGRIEVALQPLPKQDGVILEVTDTGCGISSERLDKVFDAFFTTKDQGTGLGLAICRQIVEQHGGTIAVDSEPGVGTRVTVLLPGEETLAEKEDDVIAAGG